MLLPRGCFLDYSKFDSDIKERWLLAWNLKKNIAWLPGYLDPPPVEQQWVHISDTNSEINIGLPYIHSYFGWWLWRHHLAALARDLPTSILVSTTVALSRFHMSAILAIVYLRISSVADSRRLVIPMSWFNFFKTSDFADPGFSF